MGCTGNMRVAVVALLIFGANGAPAPDKPLQSAAGGYGAPASCPLQRVEVATGYGCQESEECETKYEENCSTSYDKQCKTEYDTKCEQKYDTKCETKYESQCSTEYDTKYDTVYDDKCETKYDEKCETRYETIYEKM